MKIQKAFSLELPVKKKLLWMDFSHSSLFTKQTESSEARHHLELEKLQNDNLRIELERAQSELHMLNKRASVQEQHHGTESAAAWSRLHAVQQERDELQVKVVSVHIDYSHIASVGPLT